MIKTQHNLYAFPLERYQPDAGAKHLFRAALKGFDPLLAILSTSLDVAECTVKTDAMFTLESIDMLTIRMESVEEATLLGGGKPHLSSLSK